MLYPHWMILSQQILIGIKCLQNSGEADIIFQTNIIKIYTDLPSYTSVCMYIYDVLCDLPTFQRQIWEYDALQILISPSHHTLIYQNIFPWKWLSSKNSKLWAIFCLRILVSFKVDCKASMGLTEFLAMTGGRIICSHGKWQYLKERTVETRHLISSEQISKFWP